MESLYSLLHNYNMASLQELQGDLKANLQRLKNLQKVIVKKAILHTCTAYFFLVFYFFT